MNTDDQLAQLMQETRRRKRLKTDLSEFDDRLKEMMRLDISLPVIVDWLEKQEKKTTLQALRRYVRRTFGEEHYEEFVRRNGWMKTKGEKNEEKNKQPINSVDGKKSIGHDVPDKSPIPVNQTGEGVSEIHKILNAPTTKYPARKK